MQSRLHELRHKCKYLILAMTKSNEYCKQTYLSSSREFQLQKVKAAWRYAERNKDDDQTRPDTKLKNDRKKINLVKLALIYTAQAHHVVCT